MNNPIFSNPKNIVDFKFHQMMCKWNKLKEYTDDYELKMCIKSTIARDYYPFAKEWLNIFRDADWYRDDLN